MKWKRVTMLTGSLAVPVVLVLGVSLSGCAGSPTPGFDQLDTNANGLISGTEATQYESLDNEFRAADRDSNGRLDRAEFSAFETMETKKILEPWKVKPNQ